MLYKAYHFFKNIVIKVKCICLWFAISSALLSFHAYSNAPQANSNLIFSDVEAKVSALVKALTLDEKISLVHASGKFHINAIERLGIPEMWLSDGPHGVRQQIERHSWESANWTNDYATYLPHLTSVAASWDPYMATLHGYVLGREARERGKDFILGPGVNLARLPLYGRNFEYMGEDPVLAAKLVVPAIKAIQSQDVAATVKHYALNTQELNRVGVNAKPDERTLHEIYLPAFEAAVKLGNVYGIMGAYNQYYGTNANQSKYLVNDILKSEWGFNGVLLTDWNVDINTYDAAVNGLDLEMGTKVPSYDQYFLAQPFKKLILEKKISEQVLDEKVKRILRIQHLVGMYNPQRKRGARNTVEHQQIAKKIASNGVVLLKNNNVGEFPILPLKTHKHRNILIMGPNANKMHGNGGGSSEVKSLYEITPLKGIEKIAERENLTVNFLRAGSDKLSPIAGEYISSRHWTGTPAWHIQQFKSASQKELFKESWLVDSQLPLLPLNTPRFVKMTAQLTPLATGEHQFSIATQGDFSLLINNQKITLEFNSQDNKWEYTDLLSKGEVIDVEINYAGSQSFVLGWQAPGDLFTSEVEYLKAASEADAVIYFGGLSHGDDREAIDRTHMKLPQNQDDVLEKLLKVNPNTVVFLIAGSAVEMPWESQANAIVWGWYGGMEAGNAFADILFGKVNPSGKMPITLPKKLIDTAPIMLDDYNAEESLYKEGIFIGYRWFEQQSLPVLFSFGHGLSYTSFAISNVKLSTAIYKQPINATKEENLRITLNVTNTGSTAGAEVIQLYIHDILSSVSQPHKELKSFVKVFLKPNETKKVTLELTPKDLAFWDINTHSWMIENGEFEVLIGTSSQVIHAKRRFQYQR